MIHQYDIVIQKCAFEIIWSDICLHNFSITNVVVEKLQNEHFRILVGGHF